MARLLSIVEKQYDEKSETVSNAQHIS